MTSALAAIKAERSDFGALFRVLAVVGLRRGEALGLRWSDIDFDEETITVRRSVGAGEKGRPVVTDGKTAASRATVPVDSATLDLLRSLRREFRSSLMAAGVRPPADGFVWRSDPMATKPLTPGAVSQWWRRNRDRLGLPGTRVHDLRHFVASQLLAAGVDTVTVQARLRHASATTTLAFYSGSKCPAPMNLLRPSRQNRPGKSGPRTGIASSVTSTSPACGKPNRPQSKPHSRGGFQQANAPNWRRLSLTLSR